MAFPPLTNPAPYFSDNPYLGIVSDTYAKLFTNAIDSLLADEGCTVPCTLIYGDTYCIPCDNCIFNVATGASTGIYNKSGPIPFKTGGICPLCSGVGQMTVEAKEEGVQLMVIWDAKKFTEIGRNAAKMTKIPVVFAQTMSRVEMYPKLKAVKEAIFNTCLECINDRPFKRISEGEFCGLGQTQYVIFTWQQMS